MHDEAGRWASSTTVVGSVRKPPASTWDQQALVGADAVGVGRDAVEPLGRHEIGVGPWVAGRDEVVRCAGRVDQLHERHPYLAGELANVGTSNFPS